MTDSPRWSHHVVAKGLFTQCVVVLFEDRVSLDEVRPLLESFDGQADAPPAQDWQLRGPTLLIPFRPEVNGMVCVDVVTGAWPDDMGDPATEPVTFGAWSAGYFGPLTYPGSLARALEQPWPWPEAGALVPAHRAFVRVKTSYVLGASDDAPLFPEAYEPIAELEMVTCIALALTAGRGAIAYFNPCGEVLVDQARLAKQLASAKARNVPAIEAWANVRMRRLDAHRLLMDTVGNRQLDVSDVEAVFDDARFDPDDVARLLRNATHHLLEHGEIVGDGDTVKGGPGGIDWRVGRMDEPLLDPPRSVLRLAPDDNGAAGAREQEPS